ncbi:YhdP family protein [Mycoavidus sp. B2-EB]|uniref:YhdP family phospholipid transporter n=1 Tax=Mycoavidus sp. B2-EB TaxID=2651972 RepID=UPI0016290B12|nr:AsmA-like C-terminal region-containing protein [Mycoavidus sp. B2-EB]BBO58995.1 DUF3971 domain-containing protein [Mycoavidus sp. B2-EB]
MPASQPTPSARVVKQPSCAKRMFIAFAGLALLLLTGMTAAALTLRYGILPKLDTFRPRLEQVASRALGMQVSIGQLSGHWQGVHPRIEISQFTLQDASGRTHLIIPHTTAILSWRSLLVFKPVLSKLEIRAPEITAWRTTDGKLFIAGIAANPSLTAQNKDQHALWDWLSLQKTLSLYNSTLHWQDQTQPNLAFTLTSEQFTLFNHSGQQHTQQDMSVRVRQLSVRLDQGSALSDTAYNAPINLIKRFDGRYRAPSIEHGARIAVHGDLADLHLLSQFATLSQITPALINPITRLKPRGILRDYAIEWEQPAPHEKGQTSITHYQFKAQFENIGIATSSLPLTHQNADPFPSILSGLTRLSGSIDANEKYGTLTLASKQTSITLNTVFDEPTLKFDTLTGKMDWQVKQLDSRKLFQVQLSHLNFANTDAAGSVHGSWSNQTSKQGYLKLAADFERLLVARVPRYLPAHINPKLRAYLKHALVSGISHKAVIKVQGSLDEFPFQDPRKPGVFYISAPFESGCFNPSSDAAENPAIQPIAQWPALEDIRGHFELNRTQLKVSAKSARYRNVALKEIKAEINDISTHTDNLMISGSAHGPLDDMLHYFNASPLPNWTTHLTEQLRANGNAQLKLGLEIPRGGQAHTKVKGTLIFSKNGLTWGALPPLTALTGQLNFTERTLTLAKLQAQWLGGKITGAGGVKEEGSTALTLHGKLSAQALQNVSDDPLLATLARYLNGATDYQINVQAALNTAAQITATSDLTGLSLGLPEPFFKDAKTPMPLRFALKPVYRSQEVGSAATRATRAVQTPSSLGLFHSRLDLQMGPLNATYLLQQGPQPSVINGQITISEPASAKTEPALRGPARGIKATLNLEQLNLDAWRTALNSLFTPPTTAHSPNHHGPSKQPTPWLAWLPTHLSAQIKKLKAANRHWENTELSAQRTRNSWEAHLTSPQALGDLRWQSSLSATNGILHARFKHVNLPAPIASQTAVPTSTKLEAQASSFPAIDWVIDQLTVHGHALGQVEVAAHNTLDSNGAPVWQLDKLQLLNPAATLHATGHWDLPHQHPLTPLSARETDHAPRTALAFNLAINDVGDLLNRFGLPRTLQHGRGSLTGEMSWQGTPIALDYSNLNGSLSLALQRGQILQIEQGIGKLLGVLSLQSLARFLALDFRGIFGSGLTFDQINGAGTVRNGVGYVDHFEILSPSARITMVGNTHILQEKQNLLVTVVPSIDAGSAALATAAINPLLGFSGYLAQLALSAAISRNFSLQYAITGSWTNPQIERIPSEASKIDSQTEAAPAQSLHSRP